MNVQPFWIITVVCLQAFDNNLAWAAKVCIWKTANGTTTISKYDAGSQICCEFSGIHNKTHPAGYTVDCCGDKTYDTSRKICCGSTIHAKHITTGPDAGKSQVCCGNNFFVADERLKYCCGGAYIPQNLYCCGKESPYNASVFSCVDDQVIPIGHSICDGQVYNFENQKCCKTSNFQSLYNVSSWDRNFSCCGDKLFDKRKEQCCRHAVRPRTGKCCGGGFYNSSTEICCRGNSIVSHGVLLCCGGGSMNASNPKEKCCFAGKKSTSYRIDREICCNGALHSITKIVKPTCCGKQVFSSTTHICCNGTTVINKTASHHSTCCSPGPEIYRSCQSPEKSPEKCGKLAYSKDSDLCCNGKINKEAKALGKKCCSPGTASYHPDNETCCHSIVKEKSLGCSENPKDSRHNKLRRGQIGQYRKGICKICSPQWKPKHLMLSIYSKMTNICTQKAMKFRINKVSELSWKGVGFQWSWLNVTSKQNLYRSKDPSVRHNFTLFLPCGCPQLQRLVGRNILLLTNTEFNKKEIFLGDSDLILPGKRDLLRLVQKISTSCPNYVVQNIFKIIQKSSLG